MTARVTVRTVTAFLNLTSADLEVDAESGGWRLKERIRTCVELLRTVESKLTQSQYTVQTVRIATNPFGEWLIHHAADGAKRDAASIQTVLNDLDALLQQEGVEFFSLGPASSLDEITNVVPIIVQTSHRFSCSAIISETHDESSTAISDDSNFVDRAKASAQTILDIAAMGQTKHDGSNENNEPPPSFVQNGLGNFRFCAAASCRPFIPFFPGAKSCSNRELATDGKAATPVRFAIGLENGNIATHILKECKSIARISTTFRDQFAEHLRPIQAICETVEREDWKYLGIDTSLNPSLDPADGSIAAAMEQLEELHEFGGPGTLGVAAELTKALQSLPGIQRTGYCGLMLPVCEDRRLAELASSSGTTEGRTLRITDLLSISSVCGVGVDTVPVPGDCTVEQVTGLILDVAGIASRWNKSLSLRIFPVPDKSVGDVTAFEESPYMVNSKIFSMQ
mmetsp:Transcript_28653/g.80789  ORF Transcript_28653/g.80789 Transcript_28653/m.80789 type:complete len:454 (+) Transcript_28653:240-1601(+)